MKTEYILLLDTSTSETMLALAGLALAGLALPEKSSGQSYEVIYRWQESPSEGGVSRRHSTALLSMIETAFVEKGLSFSQLTALGVCIGPGSFTGLRVGLACVKTMAQVLSIPIYPFTRFQLLVAALARESPSCSETVLYDVQIPAQRGLMYHARLSPGSSLEDPPPHLCDETTCSYQGILPSTALKVTEQRIFSPDAMLTLLPLSAPCSWKVLEPLYIQEPNITLRHPNLGQLK